MSFTETALRDTATSAPNAQIIVGWGLTCQTCAGLICLDCAADLAHETCTRACPECSGLDHDFGQDWQLSLLATQLGGLQRLDEAVCGAGA